MVIEENVVNGFVLVVKLISCLEASSSWHCYKIDICHYHYVNMAVGIAIVISESRSLFELGCIARTTDTVSVCLRLIAVFPLNHGGEHALAHFHVAVLFSVI